MAVSIVIPLFNKERHIKNTIQTVLDQSYQDFEIIIIDDGSTDRSAQRVEEIVDSRIQLVKKENEGVSATRNLGVKIAKNELIAFLDADDEWNKNYLENIVKLSERFPEAAIYATNYNVVEKDGQTYMIQYPGVEATMGLLSNYFHSAFKFTPLWTSAVCVRKSIFQKMGGFPTHIKNGEDLDLWCRIALQYPIAYVNEPLATYRRDSDNMLSRSIIDPSWFPFLVEYDSTQPKIIKDESSIEKYILRRQLEAASASLFIIQDKAKCKKILKGVRYSHWNRKKFIGLCGISLLPQNIINILYRRIIKR